MKKSLIAIAVASVLPGCTTAQYVGSAVAGYCDLPREARAANREAMALAVSPNRIEIECDDDARLSK
jgi:hypothetical protein